MKAVINFVGPQTLHHLKALLLRFHSHTRFKKSKKTCRKIQHLVLPLHRVKEEEHLNL